MPMIADPASAERSAQQKTGDSSRPPRSSDPASVAADNSAPTNAEPLNGRNSRVRSHEAVQLQRVPVSRLKPHSRNARTHSKKQIRQIAASIQAFGFTAPILVDEDLMILAGHGRVEAAKLLGLAEVPVVQLIGLSETQKRAYLLADNRLTEKASWNRQALAIELESLSKLLVEIDLDISITGFEPTKVDGLLTDFDTESHDPADVIGPAGDQGPAVSRLGDLWLLGKHRLLCADAREAIAFDRLLGEEKAAAAFLDPPHDVQVRNIVGRGRRKHAELAMTSGEMSAPDFMRFLVQTLSHAARVSQNGAMHYVCMDWRHLGELLEVGRSIYGAMLDLAVWVKSNAGPGSFYRSQHELVGVFRVGEAAHQNKVALGRVGRNRSNVWSYRGVSSLRAGRLDERTLHATAKPVALVADALKDCTRRGDLVLDCFAGSGTTLLAAERVGRRAALMEIAPEYIDAAIRRWQAFTRADAVHAETGRTFESMAARGRNARKSRPSSRSA